MSPENRRRLADRIAKAAEASLAAQNYVSPVDVLVGIGWLDAGAVKRWRQGQVDYLERVVQTNLSRISEAMKLFRSWATAKGLIPSETSYVARTPSRQTLRFSKSGDQQSPVLSLDFFDCARDRLRRTACRRLRPARARPQRAAPDRALQARPAPRARGRSCAGLLAYRCEVAHTGSLNLLLTIPLVASHSSHRGSRPCPITVTVDYLWAKGPPASRSLQSSRAPWPAMRLRVNAQPGQA